MYAIIIKILCTRHLQSEEGLRPTACAGDVLWPFVEWPDLCARHVLCAAVDGKLYKSTRMPAYVLVCIGVFCNRLQYFIMIVDEVEDFAPSENGHLSLWAFAVPAEVEVLHLEVGDIVSDPLVDADGHAVSCFRDNVDVICAVVAG